MMKKEIIKLLVIWFKTHRTFDNYVDGDTFLTLDGSWDFEELVEYLIENGIIIFN